MAKKSGDFYFNNFIECADCAWRAAKMLESILENYTPGKLDEAISKIHEIEHEGDQKRHELVETLAKSFITPIEREDIMELSRKIDDVTDAVEDIELVTLDKISLVIDIIDDSNSNEFSINILKIKNRIQVKTTLSQLILS